MACIQEETYTCKVCKQEKREYVEHFHDHICKECTDTMIDKERRNYFKALDKLSMEERIRKIEEWIYDYVPPRNPMVYYDG